MLKITEWNPGEKMSKEFALTTVKQVKQMLRCYYYQPTINLFNNSKELFDSFMEVLDGLNDFINDSTQE